MLKEIVNKIEEIIDNNPIYNMFGEGNIWEIDGKEIQYPLVWLDAETNPHRITTSTVELVFDIWFMDLVYKDESNELNIKSDTLNSAMDFVKFLKESYDDLSFYIKDEDYTVQLFTEKWNDNLAGAKLTISITSQGAGSRCKNIFSV